MDGSVSSTVDEALKLRERLLEHLLRAQAREDDDQMVRIQYLIEVIDGALSVITRKAQLH